MVPETEVIFQNDGTVILQTDGGYATQLKTAVSAAWECVRAIRGSDPDNGWANNTPQCRMDLKDLGFLTRNRVFLSNQKQRFWSPVHSSLAAAKCRGDFFRFYNQLVKAPLRLLVACEKGDARTAEICLKGMPDSDVYEFFRIANAMAFSVDVKLAAVAEFTQRPAIPQQDLTNISGARV